MGVMFKDGAGRDAPSGDDDLRPLPSCVEGDGENGDRGSVASSSVVDESPASVVSASFFFLLFFLSNSRACDGSTALEDETQLPMGLNGFPYCHLRHDEVLRRQTRRTAASVHAAVTVVRR
jgi:hypothetical protein